MTTTDIIEEGLDTTDKLNKETLNKKKHKIQQQIIKSTHKINEMKMKLQTVENKNDAMNTLIKGLGGIGVGVSNAVIMSMVNQIVNENIKNAIRTTLENNLVNFADVEEMNNIALYNEAFVADGYEIGGEAVNIGVEIGVEPTLEFEIDYSQEVNLDTLLEGNVSEGEQLVSQITEEYGLVEETEGVEMIEYNFLNANELPTVETFMDFGYSRIEAEIMVQDTVDELSADFVIEGELIDVNVETAVEEVGIEMTEVEAFAPDLIGEGIAEEMGEAGIEMTGEIGAELGASLVEELGAEIGGGIATELLASAGIGSMMVISQGLKFLGPVGMIVGFGVSLGMAIDNLVEAYHKEEAYNKYKDEWNNNLKSTNEKLMNIDDKQYDTVEDLYKAYDNAYRTEGTMLYFNDPTMNAKPNFYKADKLIKGLDTYVNNFNTLKNNINKESELYYKWILHGNDPDGYDNGDMVGRYKPLKDMYLSNVIRNSDDSIKNRIDRELNDKYRTGLNGGNIVMKDSKMIDHYREQVFKDEDYLNKRAEFYINYKIKKDEEEALKHNPNVIDITGTSFEDEGAVGFKSYKVEEEKPDIYEGIHSPEELEMIKPPFWSNYYIQNQKRFIKNDRDLIKSSMKQYYKRGKKPLWRHKNHKGTPQERYGGMGSNMRGLVHFDNNGNIDTGTHRDKPKDTGDTHLKPKVPREPTHNHNKPILPKPDKKDKKSQPIDGSVVKIDLDNIHNRHFNPTKEWAHEEIKEEFDPNLALHYLGISDVVYDIPDRYNTIDDVPSDYGLDKYDIRMLIGNGQYKPTSFLQRLTFNNTFGICLYDNTDDIIVVGLEGTDRPALKHGDFYRFLNDVIQDLNMGRTPYEGLNIHSGLLTQALSVKDEVFRFIEDYANPNTRLVFTGHSAGGVQSMILMYLTALKFDNKDIVSYNYGCPRFLDEISVRIFNNVCKYVYRITTDSDIVPYLAPRFTDMILSKVSNFMHVGKNYNFGVKDGQLHIYSGDVAHVIDKHMSLASLGLFLLGIVAGSYVYTGSSVGGLIGTGGVLGDVYFEGASMSVFFRDVIFRLNRDILGLIIQRPDRVNYLLQSVNDLESIIRGGVQNPDSLLNRLLQERQRLFENFLATFPQLRNDISFYHPILGEVHSVHLRGMIESYEFIPDISNFNRFRGIVNRYGGVPDRAMRGFFRAMVRTNINIQNTFNTNNPMINRLFRVFFPNPESFVYYITEGIGAVSLVETVKKSLEFINTPLDTHGRSVYRKVLEKYYDIHNSMGNSVKPIKDIIGDKDLHSEDHKFSKYGNTDLYKSHKTKKLYYPTYFKGEVNMVHIPKKYIIGFYPYQKGDNPKNINLILFR